MRNNKTLIVTTIICLLPMLLGLALYDQLPDQMAVHFTMNDVPDNFAPKAFAVFGIPCILAIVQIVCCLATRYSINKYKDEMKKQPFVMTMLEWVVPVLTIIVYLLMILYGLNYAVPIGKPICFISGILLLVLGNYMPKMSYEVGRHLNHPMVKDEETYRKRVRIAGYMLVTLGIVFLVLTLFV